MFYDHRDGIGNCGKVSGLAGCQFDDVAMAQAASAHFNGALKDERHFRRYLVKVNCFVLAGLVSGFNTFLQADRSCLGDLNLNDCSRTSHSPEALLFDEQGLA